MAYTVPAPRHMRAPVPEEMGSLFRPKEEEDVPSSSVVAKDATCYPVGWIFYNWLCCCFPGWCGRDFCCARFLGIPTTIGSITARRGLWLWILHAICFAIHAFMAVYSFTAGMDSDMKVEIYRIRPTWQNRGGNYGYDIVPANGQFFYIHTVTALFFGFSALMHGVWVFIGPWEWSRPFLWYKLDDCLCWWCASARVQPLHPHSCAHPHRRVPGVGWSTRCRPPSWRPPSR